MSRAVVDESKVFRLRQLPNWACTRATAADVIRRALDLPADHVTVCSVAKTSDIWEAPPTRVATLQLRSLPRLVRESREAKEWSFPIPAKSTHASSETSSDEDAVLILDSHFEGMTVLNDVDPATHYAEYVFAPCRCVARLLSVAASCSCIAISGLASHPFGSWQPRGPDKSFMWVRDVLPKSLPGVRAIIYGYDSGLVGSKSFQTVSDIAQTLIFQLKSGGWNLPSSHTSASKPIIFLAHSLGGLVLKHAVVHMADRESSVSNILQNLHGAIMFGVPSLGMEQSHLMAMVEGQPNEALVYDLSREGGTNYLRHLNTRFEGLSYVRSARILWAYETEESPTVVRQEDGSWARSGRSVILVNRDSATSQYYRKNMAVTIPINKDHSNMVKFTRGDTNLKTIIASLNEMLVEFPPLGISDQQKLSISRPVATGSARALLNDGLEDGKSFHVSTDDNEDENLLKDLDRTLETLEGLRNDLYKPELDHRIDNIADPSTDTLAWIFDMPQFSSWLQDGSGLFWIHGKPGSGKSTLMKFIVKHKLTWELLHNWKANKVEITASFFFHYRGSALQKSFEGLLRSLITQILGAHLKQYHSPQVIWKDYVSLRKRRHAWRIALQENRARLKSLEEEMILAKSPTFESGGSAIEGISQGRSAEHELEEDRKSTPRDPDEIEKELQDVHQEYYLLGSKLAAARESVASLADGLRPSVATPEARFLAAVADKWRQENNYGLVIKLEGILKFMLEQKMVGMDLVLFFDALDEFDGHLDMLSRFIKSLVDGSSGSISSADHNSTRVKVCFSSRPWEDLQVHFADRPGFSLQDHTQHDIELYAVSRCRLAGPSVMGLVPTIIARANGVFLWVALAINILGETMAQNSPSASSGGHDLLEKRLLELPSDLLEFYELIVERIKKPIRRYTFILLELLIRHTGSSTLTITELRDAVLTSSRSTFRELTNAVSHHVPVQAAPYLAARMRNRVADDISMWGGGLVETVSQDGLDRPQLIHQTALEYIMGMQFKRVVLGDLFTITNENGHSFHTRYSISMAWAGLQSCTSFRREASMSRRSSAPRYYVGSDAVRTIPKPVREHMKRAAYHAEQSEISTGYSLFSFFNAMPTADLAVLTCADEHVWDRNCCLLFVFVSHGLMLSLRDFIESEPNVLKQLALRQQHVRIPLVSSLISAPPSGTYHEGYLAMVRLLLDNGFCLTNHDPECFSRLLGKLWQPDDANDKNIIISSSQSPPPAEAAGVGEAHTDPRTTSFNSFLVKLAILLLDHGRQDTEMTIEHFTCRSKPLHMAPPPLAVELLRCGANPNAYDSNGRTPLDWAVSPLPYMCTDWEPLPPLWTCASRFELCRILIAAGGIHSNHTSQEDWAGALSEFENSGYETWFLRAYLGRRNEELRQQQQQQRQNELRGKKNVWSRWKGKSVSFQPKSLE